MSYSLIVQPEAEEDAIVIFHDLEKIEPGLGHRFLDAWMNFTAISKSIHLDPRSATMNTDTVTCDAFTTVWST